jgi:hypothetical protein
MRSVNDITLVIQTCEAFSDVWFASMSLVAKYWPVTKNKVIYVTDTGCPENLPEGFVFLQAGKDAEYTAKMELALASVQTDYVALILDDYFLRVAIDGDFFASLLSQLDTIKGDYIRFEKQKACRRYVKACDHPDLYTIAPLESYSVNLCPSIWRVSALKKVVAGKNLNAWRFEVSSYAFCKEEGIYCLYSPRDGLPYIDGIRKGRFLRKAYRYLKKNHLYFGNRKKVRPWTVVRIKFKDFLKAILPSKTIEKMRRWGRKHGKHYYRDDVASSNDHKEA